MKKIIALIYRLLYMIFSSWALLEFSGFSLIQLWERNAQPLVWINLACFICILAVFIYSIKKEPSPGLLNVKLICTLLAALLLLLNLEDLLHILNGNWVLKILLPIMMILDWLLFDRKGGGALARFLQWLVGLILGAVVLDWILKNLFQLPGIFDLLSGLKSGLGLWHLLPGLVALAALAYLLSKLFSAKNRKYLQNTLALLFRLLFLVLEGWTFYKISRLNLGLLIKNMQYYPVLCNFLAFLCIGVVVLYNLIKFHSIKKRTSPFPRLKGVFTFAVLVAMVGYHFFERTDGALNPILLIHCYIGPFMMLLDWLLFDPKGKFQWFDPFLWLILPALYYAVTYFLLYRLTGVNLAPALFSHSAPAVCGMGMGVMLLFGYLILLTDRLLEQMNR